MTNIVIVGHGMAVRLAAAARPGGDRKVTVLGAEPHRAYNRIMLSTLLAGKIGESDVELAELAGQGVDVRAGVAVTAIAPVGRAVLTDAGERIDYDHLVLATGSRAVVPPLPGLDPARPPERMIPFRTLDDCRRILAAARGARTALVLGGGLLGLEAARGLAARGLDVVVTPSAPDGTATRPGGGPCWLAPPARCDIHWPSRRPGTPTTTGPSRPGRRRSLTPTSGPLLRVRPDTSRWPRRPVHRRPGRGGRRPAAHQRPAHLAIGTARSTMASTRLVARPGPRPVVAQALTGEDPLPGTAASAVTRLKAAGIDLAAMGDPSAGRGEELTFADPVRGTYARLRITDGRLTAAILLGDNPSVGAVIQLFDRGGPVPADRRALLLGRALGGGTTEPAASPALMPDAATVCQCNTVSKGALVRCWRAGARTVDEVVAATRAGTGCGTCRDAVTGIVQWLRIGFGGGDAMIGGRLVVVGNGMVGQRFTEALRARHRAELAGHGAGRGYRLCTTGSGSPLLRRVTPTS
jgi:assimilatory nitrate reductase electron transfer subunit